MPQKTGTLMSKQFRVQDQYYDTSLYILLNLIKAARSANHDLSDFHFKAIVAGYEESETHIAELLTTCEHPKFIRYTAGWRMQF
jgi:hypothetical protein